MASALSNKSLFVVDLLTTLRDEKFSLMAWVRFLARSWEMSRHTAHTNPGLKRSWRRVSLMLSSLALMLLVASFRLEGPSIALHLLPGFLFCVAWQINDLYWHLGLNRQPETGTLLPVIGIANFCTQLRGLAASFLLGRLVGGVPTPTALILLVFLCGIVTDILDGQIARRTKTRSKLGQITDSETDFCLYLAVTVMLIQNSILPLWVGILMLARFFLPLLATLASYFILTHPVRFGSTMWGKYAGLAQCLYFLVLLAPPQLAEITRAVNLPLLIVTLALMIAAPTAQIAANVRQEKRS
ncbi:MAG TPA: CDP-alcohol phosphatidyltransferase family protein [Ktedonobacteraceae bacterium]|nr:CDP-alcohol phosphatidyltransferase family protein [Ktedonobacteraceae bacterium]